MRSAQVIKRVRAEATEDALRSLFWKLLKHIVERKLNSDRIFNMGEMGFAQKSKSKKYWLSVDPAMCWQNPLKHHSTWLLWQPAPPMGLSPHLCILYQVRAWIVTFLTLPHNNFSQWIYDLSYIPALAWPLCVKSTSWYKAPSDVGVWWLWGPLQRRDCVQVHRSRRHFSSLTSQRNSPRPAPWCLCVQAIQNCTQAANWALYVWARGHQFIEERCSKNCLGPRNPRTLSLVSIAAEYGPSLAFGCSFGGACTTTAG